MYFLLNSNLVNTPLLASFTGSLDFWNAGVISSKFQTFPGLLFSLSLALLPAYCANTYSALTEKSGPDDQTVYLSSDRSMTRERDDKVARQLFRRRNTTLAQCRERLRQTQSTGVTVSPTHQAPPRP